MRELVIRILINDKTLYGLFAITCIGIYYSQAVVSIATVIFLVIGLVGMTRRGAIRVLWTDQWMIALMSVVLVYLASGLNSANTAAWFTRVVSNVPYIAIPLGLHAFGPFTKRLITRLLCIFIGVTALSAALVLLDYAQHFTEYNAIYKVGKTIPTPIIHVRYSYFIALSCMLCAGMLLDGLLTSLRIRRVILALSVFLLIFLHLLAVRTGLLAFYGGLILMIILMVIRDKKWKPALFAIVAMGALATGAYLTMPSLANKIRYMRYDLRMLREQGALPEYSDNARLTSIAHGLALFADHPIIGVGLGDVKDQMQQMYEQRTPDFPEDRRYLPISQYVFWLVAFGLLGTALLMGLWAYPLVQLWNKSYLIAAIYGATLFSFFAETSIQLQLGKTMFLLLLCISLQYWRSNVVAQPIFTPRDLSGNNLVE